MEHKRNTYITMNGLEVEIRAISIIEMNLAEQGLRQEYINRGESLDPPKYKVELAGGGEQWFPHDETTLNTDEEKAAWKAYQEATLKYERERAELIQEIVFNDGIPLELTKDTAWIDKQKKRHIQIPDEPDELRQHWLLTEILKTPDDIRGVIAAVLSLSARGAADPEAVEAALAGFRNRVSTQREERPEAAFGDNGQKIAVETHNPAKRTPRGKRMASKAK